MDSSLSQITSRIYPKLIQIFSLCYHGSPSNIKSIFLVFLHIHYTKKIRIFNADTTYSVVENDSTQYVVEVFLKKDVGK